MNQYVATIGMFDGVHRGHRFVLSRLMAVARQRGLQSLVVTFDHSPRQEQVLTPLDVKLRLLRATGVDRVEVLRFTPQLKSLTAHAFMQQVLRDQFGVRVLLTGYDNRFGHHREEGFDDYVRYGRELGIDVCGLPQAPVADAAGVASSSAVRRLLADGDVAAAAQLLAQPYTLEGRVAHGHHIGTTLGFPTANLVPLCAQQLVPAPGVYAVRVGLSASVGGDVPVSIAAMMNIGTRPTFDGRQMTLEVHLFDYSGDLYGRQLSVSFVRRLRSEQRFSSAAALAAQLRQDAAAARQELEKPLNL